LNADDLNYLRPPASMLETPPSLEQIHSAILGHCIEWNVSNPHVSAEMKVEFETVLGPFPATSYFTCTCID
jgi:hypothetical protein